MAADQFVDYYEFLMVNPTADRAMIEWAVRLMLTRYGKKSGEHTDPAKYELVKEAYRTLADPKRRELYDALRRDQTAPPAPEFRDESPAPPANMLTPVRVKDKTATVDVVQVEHSVTRADVELQIQLRQGVMSSLYEIVITRPRNPELGRAEIARAAGVRIDEIEFTIWFLREKGLLKTTNQGLYAITAKGVEWVESGGVPHLTPEDHASGEKPKSPASETNGVPHPLAASARRVV